MQQEIIKNAGNQNIISNPQSQSEDVGSSVAGTGTGVGEVKVFTTDTPLVTAASTAHSNLKGSSSTASSSSGSNGDSGGGKKGEKEKGKSSNAPQMTYATRLKKKKTT